MQLNDDSDSDSDDALKCWFPGALQELRQGFDGQETLSRQNCKRLSHSPTKTIKVSEEKTPLFCCQVYLIHGGFLK